MDVNFAQATFLIADNNLKLAEDYLVELLENESIGLSWSSKYRILARLVHVYMQTNRINLAELAIEKMEEMPNNSIDAYSIEIGAYAKMAYAGVDNAYELDPVFSGYKESGMDWWAKFLLVAAGLGLLATLLITGRYLLTPALPRDPSHIWSRFS